MKKLLALVKTKSKTKEQITKEFIAQLKDCGVNVIDNSKKEKKEASINKPPKD